MFKIHEITAGLVALALIAVAVFYGLFNITLGGIIVIALVLVIGVLGGMGLGRNSKTANALYDRALAEAENLRANARLTNSHAKKEERAAGNG